MGAAGSTSPSAKLKKKDWDSFKSLTDYIIDTFGLEPRWDITVIVDTSDKLAPAVLASTDWPNHYREAEILVNIKNLDDRTSYVYVLIHEICHLIGAQIHDMVMENVGKVQQQLFYDLFETYTSELANTITSIFIKAHGKNIKKWL